MTVEAHAALGRLDQAQDEAADGRFAAAGFADEAQRLAGLEREADAVDGLDLGARALEQAAPHGKVFLEAVDLEDEPADARLLDRCRRRCALGGHDATSSSAMKQAARCGPPSRLPMSRKVGASRWQRSMA